LAHKRLKLTESVRELHVIGRREHRGNFVMGQSLRCYTATTGMTFTAGMTTAVCFVGPNRLPREPAPMIIWR